MAQASSVALPATAAPALTLAHFGAGRPLTLQGSAASGATVRVVLDGKLERALAATADAQVRWTASLDLGRYGVPGTEHRIVVWDGGQAVSAARTVRNALPWLPVAEVEDPAGDNAGPQGRYVYPTDPGYAPRQMDLRRVQVWRAGQALRVDATMASLTDMWSPRQRQRQIRSCHEHRSKPHQETPMRRSILSAVFVPIAPLAQAQEQQVNVPERRAGAESG